MYFNALLRKGYPYNHLKAIKDPDKTIPIHNKVSQDDGIGWSVVEDQLLYGSSNF
jgi:hypothetical protein